MNKKLKWAIILFTGIALTISILSFVSTKEKTLTTLIVNAVKKFHYSSPKFNDEFSKKTFNKFIENIDYNKRFFYQSDIKKLEKYKFEIDNQIHNQKLQLFEEAYEILDKRIQFIQKYANKILDKPFQFQKNEHFITDSDKRKYSKNRKENKIFWRQYLKYKTLIRYYNILSSNKDKKIKKKKNTSWDVLNLKKEAEARQKVKKSINRQFNRMLKEEKPERINVFINSFLSVLDPHTNYFPPIQKEDFDIEMSGRLEGIGAVLTESDGYIKIVRIVPGSASWKQKQLKVAQGDGEPVDIVDSRVKDAVKLIRGKKGTEVRLTVQKPDGRIMVIPIIRDIVILEESYAKSVVIYHRKLQKKFGYIYLPKFYRDFYNYNGRKSSTDIKKEIEKLKKHNIKGIILDLRKNGGGALDDAIKMSGLFIEDGPIVQVKSKEDEYGQSKNKVLYDPDPNIIYSEKLIIMIDTLSASASEILAAAMQDYNRALIVGSKHTFGKGTVQTIYDLVSQ